MCRMIGFKLSRQSRIKLLINLMYSLRRIAENDPLLYYKSHSDGWGYVVLQDDKLYEYHADKPIYMDDKGVDTLVKIVEKKHNYSTGIIHARRASKRMPKGLIHTHPYHYSTYPEHEVWIAFNGSLTPLQDEIMRTDAYILGSNLVEKCRNIKEHKEFTECLIRQYSLSKDRVESGGVLLSMIITQSKDEIKHSLALYPYYKLKNKDLMEYYRYYMYKSRYTIIVASSSIYHDYKSRIGRGKEWISIEEDKPLII